MKNLLVPFDFSHNSRNALEYAAQLAKLLDARLHVFHAYDRSEVLEGVKVATTVSAMKDTRVSISKKFGLKLDKIEHHVLQGEFLEEALEFISSHKIDLILIGTRGASGLKELLVGSATVSLMQEVEGVPMLVIPEAASYKPLEHILLLSDLNEIADDNALDLVKELAIAFNANVRIATVEDDNGEPTFEKVLEERRETHIFQPEVDCEFKRIRARDILEGIRFYMEQKGDNDMVAMVYRRHTFVDVIFGTNHTYQMAYHTDIPLLVLPEAKVQR